MGGQRKDLKHDIDSGFMRLPIGDRRAKSRRVTTSPSTRTNRGTRTASRYRPSVKAASMVDMEPVQSRTLDAESKQRALWPFKPPNPGRKWENSCSTSTGQYQDTQYDEQPKRHDKRRYARLAPRESLDHVPERSAHRRRPTHLHHRLDGR